MNNSSKILKIIFVVLLIITSAELFYFFVYQPKKTELTLPNPIQVKKDDKQTYEQYLKTIPNKGAVNRTFIDYLVKRQPAQDDKLYLVFEKLGEISAVEKNGYLSNGKPFDIKFKLTNKEGKIFDTYYFILKSMVDIYKIVDSQKIKLADFTEFEEGDTVKYVGTSDMSKNINEAVVKIELSLYKQK